MDAARILCVGDLHLGRTPSWLPGYAAGDLDLAPPGALERVVAYALDECVDAVLFAGDVVESREDRFEAFGHLERAVLRLIEGGISVLGVAGNHDDLALPRLARRIEGFHLLGEGGRWECADVPTRDGPSLRVHGWSFPGPRVTESPLARNGPRRGGDGAVEIGLLHADLDQSASPYAPVRHADLVAAGLDAFLLGHVHKPADLAAMTPPVGYLGSLSPLDPGETGRRGAWLLEARAPGAVTMRPVVYARLRYDRVRVDVSEADAATLEEDLESRVVDALRAHAEHLVEECRDEEPPRLVLARVTLTGRTPAHGAVLRLLEREGERWRDLETERHGIRVRVETLVDEMRPAIDLADIGRAADPAGLLAREIEALTRGEETVLLVQVRRELEKEARKPTWRALEGSVAARPSGVSAPDDEARERLLAVAASLLEDLLAQRDAAGGRDTPA